MSVDVILLCYNCGTCTKLQGHCMLFLQVENIYNVYTLRTSTTSALR